MPSFANLRAARRRLALTYKAFTKGERNMPDYIAGPDYGSGVYVTIKGGFNPVLWNGRVGERFDTLIAALHEEILSVRLNRIKQLLTETRLSLEQIAEAMGYEHPEYLSVVFKREVGASPREYRRRQ